MKKFLLFILSLTIFLSAAVVPVERAKKVAENYYHNYAPVSEKSNAVQKVLTKEYMGQPTWYVFQFTKGWVIVAADDAVRPILGYSFDRKIVHVARENGYIDASAQKEWKDIETSGLSGGMYLYKLEADGKVFTKKMTVVN